MATYYIFSSLGKQELDSYHIYSYFAPIPLWMNIIHVQGYPPVSEGSPTGAFVLCDFSKA